MPIAPTAPHPAASAADSIDCGRATGPSTPEAGLAAGVPGTDWDLLFDAVTARLRGIAGMVATLPDLHGLPALARNRVLECAEALEQLHASMTQHQQQRGMLQRQLHSVQGELDRAALAHTQDGERRLRHHAQHDPLTALPNRDHFRNLLGHALRPSESRPPTLALMILDLDGFKPINDQHGRAVGDRMLRIVATRLTRAIRAGDCVGRVGDDEFACMLGDIDDREQLSHLACKLFDAVSAPLKIGALKLTVRPSIGVAVSPGDGGGADTLLARADTAMVRAKRAQSGYAFFDRSADTSAGA